MSITAYDKTGEPRDSKEIQEVIIALKNALVLSNLDPIMVHYPTIWDSLYELLSLRNRFNRYRKYKHLLHNILAYVHRDGGHYTENHGIEKSVGDAIAIIANFNANIVEDGDLVCPRCTLNMGKYPIEEPYKFKCPRCGHGWQSWMPITS